MAQNDDATDQQATEKCCKDADAARKKKTDKISSENFGRLQKPQSCRTTHAKWKWPKVVFEHVIAFELRTWGAASPQQTS